MVRYKYSYLCEISILTVLPSRMASCSRCILILVGGGNWQYKYPAPCPIGFDERFSVALLRRGRKVNCGMRPHDLGIKNG